MFTRNTFDMHGVIPLFHFSEDSRQPGVPEKAVVGIVLYSCITHVRDEACKGDDTPSVRNERIKCICVCRVCTNHVVHVER